MSMRAKLKRQEGYAMREAMQEKVRILGVFFFPISSPAGCSSGQGRDAPLVGGSKLAGKCGAGQRLLEWPCYEMYPVCCLPWLQLNDWFLRSRDPESGAFPDLPDAAKGGSKARQLLARLAAATAPAPQAAGAGLRNQPNLQALACRLADCALNACLFCRRLLQAILHPAPPALSTEEATALAALKEKEAKAKAPKQTKAKGG